MFNWLKNYLLYANLDPNEIRKVRVPIAKRNHFTLRVFSILSSVFYGFAVVFALFSNVDGITQKLVGYSIGFSLSLIIALTNRIFVTRHPKILPVLLLLFNLTLYGTGLFLTFVSSPNQLTITLYVMFMLVPLLFIDKPYRSVLLTILTASIFITLHVATDIKPAEMCKQEIVNLFLFAVLGAILGAYMTRLSFERFIFEHQVDQINHSIQQTQNMFWRSIADIYISMVQVDLEKNSYKILRTNSYIDDAVSKDNDDFSKNIALVMTATTDPAHLDDILKFVDPTTLAERIKGKRTITHEFMGKNFGWCRARYIAVDSKENEAPRQVIYLVENINEQKSREQHLTTMAETDAMTGLFNRQAGSSKIKEALYHGHDGMLCLFDVDKFKDVNDTFGHQTGDDVICAVADAMRKAFRDNDILLRLGGDEFVVFVPNIKTEELGAKIIQRFFSTLDEAIIKGHEDYKISVSLGATFAEKESVFEDLYKQADSCTYESKKIKGKSFTFYRG